MRLLETETSSLPFCREETEAETSWGAESEVQCKPSLKYLLVFFSLHQIQRYIIVIIFLFLLLQEYPGDFGDLQNAAVVFLNRDSQTVNEFWTQVVSVYIQCLLFILCNVCIEFSFFIVHNTHFLSLCHILYLHI